MDWTFDVGERLLIELKTKEVFEGVYANGTQSRLDLINVTNHKSIKDGFYSFYNHEVAKVQRRRSKERQDIEEAQSTCKLAEGIRKIQIGEDEYKRLREIPDNFIFIDKFEGDDYIQVCETLNEAQTIGIVGLGMSTDHSPNIQLLVMSTWKEVFIFDFANMCANNVPVELKKLMENCVTKIVHGGGLLVNRLSKVLDISLENVFDTQIVDLTITKRDTGKYPTRFRKLSQCLSHYLNFSESLLKEAEETSNKQWSKRPLVFETLKYAAQLATYLHILKNQMENELLKLAYKSIENVHELYFQSDDYNFRRRLCDTTCGEDINELIPKLPNKINKTEVDDN